MLSVTVPGRCERGIAFVVGGVCSGVCEALLFFSVLCVSFFRVLCFSVCSATGVSVQWCELRCVCSALCSACVCVEDASVLCGTRLVSQRVLGIESGDRSKCVRVWFCIPSVPSGA